MDAYSFPDSFTSLFWLQTPVDVQNDDLGIMSAEVGSIMRDWQFNEGKFQLFWQSNESLPTREVDISKFDFSNFHYLGLRYNGSHSSGIVDTEFYDTDHIGDVTPAKIDQTIKLGKAYQPDFEGKLDEFRLYNRSLSQQEVKRLYEVRSEDWAVSGCKLTGTAVRQVIKEYVFGIIVL
ncbi:MAG: LamG-like jellyroll fold domain-containing protein [Candidatus Nanohalobium sp.]